MKIKIGKVDDITLEDKKKIEHARKPEHRTEGICVESRVTATLFSCPLEGVYPMVGCRKIMILIYWQVCYDLQEARYKGSQGAEITHASEPVAVSGTSPET